MLKKKMIEDWPFIIHNKIVIKTEKNKQKIIFDSMENHNESNVKIECVCVFS